MGEAAPFARIGTITGRRRASWRVLLVLAWGSVSAAAVGAPSLANWAASLPDGPGIATLRIVTQRWEGAMGVTGLAQLYAGLRATVRRYEAAP